MKRRSIEICTAGCLDAGQHLDVTLLALPHLRMGWSSSSAAPGASTRSNPAIAAVLDHVIADKERHAAFGWLYLGEPERRIGRPRNASSSQRN